MERDRGKKLAETDFRIGEIDSSLSRLEKEHTRLMIEVSGKTPEEFARECAEEGILFDEAHCALDIALRKGRISDREWRKTRSELLRKEASQLLDVADALDRANESSHTRCVHR